MHMRDWCRGLLKWREAISLEHQTLMENVAFFCTYGKSNCLTRSMYTGALSWGKIFSLVSEKLGAGVFVCK